MNGKKSKMLRRAHAVGVSTGSTEQKRDVYLVYKSIPKPARGLCTKTVTKLLGNVAVLAKRREQ